MWMINPKLLCRKHLLGEHNEIHKFRHVFEKKYSIKGRIEPVVQIEPLFMQWRHNELVWEMLDRRYNHNSPYTRPNLDYLPNYHKYAVVDIKQSIADLKARCPECRERIESHDKTTN
jgi:hypothetical protein